MKALIASLCLAVGCASLGNTPRTEPSTSLLTVVNQRTEQATIYVVHDGVRGRRLGDVNSLASASFLLTSSDAASAADVQFLARSYVTGRLELSDPVVATRGMIYEWKLSPAQGQQFLSYRYAAR